MANRKFAVCSPKTIKMRITNYTALFRKLCCQRTVQVSGELTTEPFTVVVSRSRKEDF